MISLTTLLLIILIVILLLSIPAWPHSANWGYSPVGAVLVILIVILILMLLGKL